jgi:hypothetical protein
MSNSKISALTAATTPLAGTETLPVVQSGATTKVTVANLTAGRAVSATQYTSTIATGTAPLVVSSTTNVANLNASSLGGATFAAPGAIGGGTASAITGTTIAGTDTTDATSTTAAALKTAGGLAVVKKTYVGDNIVQGTAAKGFDFSANTPQAGKTSTILNWYEEGTWTPTDASGAGLSLTVNGTAFYTKVGRVVTITFNVTYPVTSNTANATIGGRPFTSVNANQTGLVISNGGSGSASAVRLGASGTTIFLYNATGAQITNATMSTINVYGSITYLSA